MPRNITVTFEGGDTHTYRNAPDNVTPEQVQARAEQEFGQPVIALDGGRGILDSEPVRVTDTVVRGGLLGGPKAVAELIKAKTAQLTPDKVESYTPAALLARARDAIVPKSVDEALLKAMTPNRPQSTAGQYAGSVGEGAVAALTGGPLRNAGSLAVTGAASGLGAEAAGQATKDPSTGEQNPLARLLGGLVGGGLSGFLSSRKANVNTIIKDNTSGMKGEDWRKARDTEAILNRLGLSHLKSQLLGPASSLDDAVAKASENPKARSQLLSAVSPVQGQTRQAVDNWAAEHLPVQLDPRRDFMETVQRTAAGREKKLVEASNAAYTNKLPFGVDLESYSPEFVQNLRTKLLNLADDSSAGFGAKSDHGDFIRGFVEEKFPLPKPAPAPVPATNIGQQLSRQNPSAPQMEGIAKMELNNIIKDLNTHAEKVGYKGFGLGKLKEVLKEATDADFGEARRAKDAYMQNVVEPYQRSVAGDLARGRGGVNPHKYTAADATAATFPMEKAQPEEIRNLSKAIGGDGVGLILRDHIMRSFEKAVTRAGDLQQRTPKIFVDTVVGPEVSAQRKNVEEALNIVAKYHGQDPAAVREGFRKLVNAFTTYKDLKLSSGVSGAQLDFQAGKNALGAAVAPQSRFGRWTWDLSSSKTYQKLADLVTSPDGLAKLEKIARSRDPSYTRAVVQSLIVESQDGRNTPGLQPSNTPE